MYREQPKRREQQETARRVTESSRPATARRSASQALRTDEPSTHSRRIFIQRALQVGAADDPYEREADAVADHVMGILRLSDDPGIVVPSDASVEGGGRIRRAAPIAGSIRRTPTRIVRSAMSLVGREGGMVDGEVESKIRSSRSGQALDPILRQGMEGAFGADFSNIRVHRDSAVAPTIAARAFTHGSDVHFAPGAYSPESASGQRLIAHELTHTLQQGSAQRTMRSTAPVQRDHTDTGIKKEAAIEGFSKKVKARATGAKNPMGSTKEFNKLAYGHRVAKIVKYVNAPLAKAHTPEVSGSVSSSMTFPNAEFDFVTWKVVVGPLADDADMSDDQIGSLSDNVYHESRHADQWFRIARLKAGESPAPTADELAASLSIPASVAAAAVKRPIKPLTKLQRFFHTKKWGERQDVKLAEAESWYESIYGANGATRNEVLGDIQVRYDEYRALSEEVDAWDAGGKAGAKVRQLIAANRLKAAAAAKAKADAKSKIKSKAKSGG